MFFTADRQTDDCSQCMIYDRSTVANYLIAHGNTEYITKREAHISHCVNHHLPRRSFHICTVVACSVIVSSDCDPNYTLSKESNSSRYAVETKTKNTHRKSYPLSPLFLNNCLPKFCSSVIWPPEESHWKCSKQTLYFSVSSVIYLVYETDCSTGPQLLGNDSRIERPSNSKTSPSLMHNTELCVYVWRSVDRKVVNHRC